LRRRITWKKEKEKEAEEKEEEAPVRTIARVVAGGRGGGRGGGVVMVVAIKAHPPTRSRTYWEKRTKG